MQQPDENPRFEPIDRALRTLERAISEHVSECTHGELDQLYDRLQKLVIAVSTVLIGREVRSDT